MLPRCQTRRVFVSSVIFCYLNDTEEQFHISHINGVDVDMIKTFMLLYADDIGIFANSPAELPSGLDLLSQYCKRWKLNINVSKTKGGALPRNIL